jgi:hypothetical protein
MKLCRHLIYLLLAAGTESVFGADLQDVLAHPEKYDECQVDLVGIARVPGYFYLFADIDAAAKTDLSKALLIRMNNFAGKGYRELDRQLVRITGLMSSKPRRGWDPDTGVLLERAELLQDRPAPWIADATVLGVFQNATNEAVAINLFPRSDPGRATFFLGPYDTDKTIIWEGQAVVSRLKGAQSIPLDKREAGESIARCEITFRELPADYPYSPEWSNKRTLYFRIFSNRMDLVSASEARDWKVTESQTGPM